jgi:1-phosphofructokinase
MHEPVSTARPNNTICVITPSPLFTITIEQSPVNRPETHFHAGGQGFWVARMAASLGADVRLCGPFGGESGPILKMLIESEGVKVNGSPCRADNGGYIHDRRGGERQVVVDVAAPELLRHEVDDLYQNALTESLKAGTAVITGPAHQGIVPPDIFRRWAHDLGENGVDVVADLSGDALLSLRGRIRFLKVSHVEAIDCGLARNDSKQELLKAVEHLHDAGAENVVLSRADAPALAFVSGITVEVRPPRFEPLDYRGAGDSMTAALAVAVATGMAMEQCLRMAAAAGALNVTRRGLGTGRRENVLRLAELVELHPVQM